MYSDLRQKYIVKYMEFITQYNKNTYVPKRILAPAAEYTHTLLQYTHEYSYIYCIPQNTVRIPRISINIRRADSIPRVTTKYIQVVQNTYSIRIHQAYMTHGHVKGDTLRIRR